MLQLNIKQGNQRVSIAVDVWSIIRHGMSHVGFFFPSFPLSLPCRLRNLLQLATDFAACLVSQLPEPESHLHFREQQLHAKLDVKILLEKGWEAAPWILSPLNEHHTRSNEPSSCGAETPPDMEDFQEFQRACWVSLIKSHLYNRDIVLGRTAVLREKLNLGEDISPFLSRTALIEQKELRKQFKKHNAQEAHNFTTSWVLN